MNNKNAPYTKREELVESFEVMKEAVSDFRSKLTELHEAILESLERQGIPIEDYRRDYSDVLTHYNNGRYSSAYALMLELYNLYL